MSPYLENILFVPQISEHFLLLINGGRKILRTKILSTTQPLMGLNQNLSSKIIQFQN